MVSTLHSPRIRGAMRYFDLSLIEQAFENYAAMAPEKQKDFADLIAAHHDDTMTKNPFLEATQ